MGPQDKKEDRVQLTLGSRFAIRSVGTRDEVLVTRGTFKGIVSVGAADGIAMELDDSHDDLTGKIRVIPSHVILAVDILELKEPDADHRQEESHIHYT